MITAITMITDHHDRHDHRDQDHHHHHHHHNNNNNFATIHQFLYNMFCFQYFSWRVLPVLILSSLLTSGYMEVSQNWGTPKSSIFNRPRPFHSAPSRFGVHHLWNPPYHCTRSLQGFLKTIGLFEHSGENLNFIVTLWLFNIAMENCPFIDGLPGFTY